MNAPIMTVYTGKRAEQVISGATMIVSSRSRQWPMVRVAMMPGIAHAKLDSNGMKARPDSPTRASAPATALGAGVEVVLAGGRRLRLERGFDPGTLSAAVQALEGRAC